MATDYPPSERTWYDTVQHDTIYNTTLSGHRSQYSYLTDIHEQELLDFRPLSISHFVMWGIV